MLGNKRKTREKNGRKGKGHIVYNLKHEGRLDMIEKEGALWAET